MLSPVKERVPSPSSVEEPIDTVALIEFNVFFTKSDLEALADSDSEGRKKKKCHHCGKELDEYIWLKHQVLFHLKNGQLTTSKELWRLRQLYLSGKRVHAGYGIWYNIDHDVITPSEIIPWNGDYVQNFYGEFVEIKLICKIPSGISHRDLLRKTIEIHGSFAEPVKKYNGRNWPDVVDLSPEDELLAMFGY